MYSELFPRKNCNDWCCVEPTFYALSTTYLSSPKKTHTLSYIYIIHFHLSKKTGGVPRIIYTRTNHAKINTNYILSPASSRASEHYICHCMLWPVSKLKSPAPSQSHVAMQVYTYMYGGRAMDMQQSWSIRLLKLHKWPGLAITEKTIMCLSQTTGVDDGHYIATHCCRVQTACYWILVKANWNEPATNQTRQPQRYGTSYLVLLNWPHQLKLALSVSVDQIKTLCVTDTDTCMAVLVFSSFLPKWQPPAPYSILEVICTVPSDDRCISVGSCLLDYWLIKYLCSWLTGSTPFSIFIFR